MGGENIFFYSSLDGQTRVYDINRSPQRKNMLLFGTKTILKSTDMEYTLCCTERWGYHVLEQAKKDLMEKYFSSLPHVWGHVITRHKVSIVTKVRDAENIYKIKNYIFS